MGEETKLTSMIIRGADGSVYHVTDAELSPYKLSDEQVAKLNQITGADNEVVRVDNGTLLTDLGIETNDSYVIMIVSISALHNWRK